MIKVFLWGKKRKRGPFVIDDVTKYKFDSGFLCLELEDGKAVCYNLKFIESFEVCK